MICLFKIDEILRKLDRYYTKGEIFKAYIDGKNLFPMEIRLKRISQKDLQFHLSSIQKEMKALENFGFNISYREFHYKLLGTQNLPVSIILNSLDEFLRATHHIREFDIFKTDYQVIASKYPKLKNFFLKKPFNILQYTDDWGRILKVLNFFINNKNPNIYIREICLPEIDTKFIQRYKKILDELLSCIFETDSLHSLSDFAFEKRYLLKYPLPQVRFRILESSLFINNISDLTLNLNEFKELKIECKKVFIIENKITFLSFFNTKGAIAIFGQGYGVSILKNVKWLKNKEIYYWGDIDSDGFAILSQARGYFAQIKSFCMDLETIKTFQNAIIPLKNRVKKEPTLKNLTKAEIETYNFVKNKNIRVEQERIDFDFVKSSLDF